MGHKARMLRIPVLLTVNLDCSKCRCLHYDTNYHHAQLLYEQKVEAEKFAIKS